MNKISGRYCSKLHRLIFDKFVLEDMDKIQLYYFKSNFLTKYENITIPKLVNILMKDVGYMCNIHIRDEQNKIIDTFYTHYTHDHPHHIYIYDNYKDLKDGYNNELYEFIFFLRHRIKQLSCENSISSETEIHELQNKINDYKNRFIDTDYIMEKMVRGE